ncbi:hypothetical protein ACJ41O_013582 [Fusarium nematophilum]
MSAPPVPLPPGYATIRSILDGQVQARSMVNIVGIVVDFRTPIQTRGKDWKCQIQLYDCSVEDDTDSSIFFNIFRPQNEMPTPGRGDVMLIRSVRVQKYQVEAPSLITSYETKIAVYTAAKIPKPPSNASGALHPPARPKDRVPDDKENALVSRIYHTIDKNRVPDEDEFEKMVLLSSNVKNKFSLLQDVREKQFYDIVVQVVKTPYDSGDKVTLWVTDFTENSDFYNFTYDVEKLSDGRDGDPYGYLSKFAKPASSTDWPGPFGKRCIQITCWEPHATAIRETGISPGTWVSVRNLQIKLGHNGSNLEGFLREDRGANGPKLGIYPLNPADDPENINPHMKEALRRKRDYERLKKGQLKDITEASKAGQKRKTELSSESEPKKKNSRGRRKSRRALAQLNEQKEQEPIRIEGLNSQVKCENQDKATSFVAEMVESIHHQTTIDGQEVKLKLPFVNTNHRTNVRVVDFRPSNLAEFSFPKKLSEYDCLSDDGGESISSSDSEEEESGQTTLEEFTTKRQWEWRFYLQLEDAAVPEKQKKQRMWVAVDNQAAQCLMDLDASNLRHDKGNLDALRDKLFLLWGDLEEHKSREQEKQREAIRAARQGKPPSDSGDEDEPETEPKTAGKVQVANRPFSCCIRQYGVKVRESDPAKADAGEGRRWERMFGLFGTRIAGP